MLEKGCVGIWLEGTEMAWDGLATWLWNTGSAPWPSWRVMEMEVPRDQAKYKTMIHPTSTSCAGTLQDSFCHDQKGWVQKIKNKKKGWPLLTFWLQNILESRVFQVLWIQFQRYLRLYELSRADQAPLFNFDSEQAFFIEKKIVSREAVCSMIQSQRRFYFLCAASFSCPEPLTFLLGTEGISNVGTVFPLRTRRGDSWGKADAEDSPSAPIFNTFSTYPSFSSPTPALIPTQPVLVASHSPD